MTNEKVAALVAGYLAGKSPAHLAIQLGISRPTAYLWLRKAGYSRQRPTCGTEAGYQLHLRAGQPTCSDCRSAHTGVVQEWRDRPASAGVIESSQIRAAATARWTAAERKAVAFTLSHAADVNDARGLLEMLGLLPFISEDAQIEHIA